MPEQSSPAHALPALTSRGSACLMRVSFTPDKGLHDGLAASAGELQAAVRPVPLVEHESYLSSNRPIRRQTCTSSQPPYLPSLGS